MGLFKNKEPSSNFYIGGTLSEKVPAKLIRVASVTGGLRAGSEVRAVLGAAAFPTASNFLICTDDYLAYVSTGGVAFKSSIYQFDTITGVSLESKTAFMQNIVLTVGGGECIVCDVGATMQDTQQCFDLIQSSIKACSMKPDVPAFQVGSVADEILKFKQLLDAGIITQEEFETKKKQLLK